MNVPETDLTKLRRRINATKWPDRETVTDATQGVQLETTQALARYWATNYDWRKIEAKLNALPQFITEIDGLDIHFIHVRSKHDNALPIIVTHGWPGSIIEQLKIIDPLTNPTAHGGSASDAFDVVNSVPPPRLAAASAAGESAAPTVARVTANRIRGAQAVDDFIASAQANGMQIAGKGEVSVQTPFGLRKYDLALRDPGTNELWGVEIKSSEGAFNRFDRAARQQFAADRWVTEFGADVVGQNADLGRIRGSYKILWEP